MKYTCNHRLEKSKMASKGCCRSCWYKQDYAADPLKHNIQSMKWYYANKERRQAKEKERLKNPFIRKIKNMRARLYVAVFRNKPSTTYIKEFGCSNIELRNHIQSLFQDGMGWNNYGLGMDQWQLDHIIPLISALDDDRKLKKLNHFTNIQPLYHRENLKKGCKI